jgi:hypothetical protein
MKASSTAIKGTLTRHTEPHQDCSSRAPLTTGPIAAPAAKQLIQIRDRLPALLLVDQHVADQRQRQPTSPWCWNSLRTPH